MFTSIQNYCDRLVRDFVKIPEERKERLEKISNYILKKKLNNQPANLIYICTHNSRRSVFGQIWAKVASEYYNILNINTFSGGTEATTFNKNAISALERAGFKIKPLTFDINAIYQVSYDDAKNPIECFSKVYNDPKNPGKGFAAIMTCSDAETNCPYIPRIDLKVGTSYDDPKAFDNTELQNLKYDERCSQIALETLYAFSKIH